MRPGRNGRRRKGRAVLETSVDLRRHAAPSRIEAYDETVALYTRKIATRVTAVYRVGAMTFPGLSDIDLLIVVPESRRDNNQFFSVFNRLPRLFHTLFRHQPSVLPQTAVDVFQHSSHNRPLLLIGDNVLENRQVLTTKEELWCKFLEGYCNEEVYLSRCRKQGRISARQAIAQATSLRYVLQRGDALLSTEHAVPYAQQIDALRAALFTEPAKDQALCLRFGVCSGGKCSGSKQNSANFCHCRKMNLFGNSAIGFCRVAARFTHLIRLRFTSADKKIDFYHAELGRLKFSYGHLFPGAAYDTSSQRYAQWSFERRFYSMYYKMGTELTSAFPKSGRASDALRFLPRGRIANNRVS